MSFPSNYSSHPTKAWLLMPLISLFSIITATTLGEPRWEGSLEASHIPMVTLSVRRQFNEWPCLLTKMCWLETTYFYISYKLQLLERVHNLAPVESFNVTWGHSLAHWSIAQWPVGRALPSQCPPSALRKVSDSPSYSRTLSHQALSIIPFTL